MPHKPALDPDPHKPEQTPSEPDPLQTYLDLLAAVSLTPGRSEWCTPGHKGGQVYDHLDLNSEM